MVYYYYFYAVGNNIFKTNNIRVIKDSFYLPGLFELTVLVRLYARTLFHSPSSGNMYNPWF